MRNIAFYANWAQFWGGPTGGGKYNSPLTYLPFLKGVDRVIYGFVMFGVKPNPSLNTQPTLNIYGGVNTGCAYHDHNETPYMESGDWGTYMMYPSECFTGTTVPWWQQLVAPFAWLFGLDSLLETNKRFSDPDCFTMFKMLQTVAPKLEIVLSYGGWTWTHGGAQFSPYSASKYHDMVSSPENRAAFIASSYAFIKGYGFNGVDFDWEYPGQTNGGVSAQNASYDFINFQNLISEYRQYVTNKGDPNFIITMQASGFLSQNIIDNNITNLPGYPGWSMLTDEDYFKWLKNLLNMGLSEINMMTYDFYVAQADGTTLPNAPLTCGDSHLTIKCIDKTINLMKTILTGDELAKVNLGLACYGRSFAGVTGLGSLGSTNAMIQESVGLKTTGPLPTMGYGGENGVVSYYTIQQKLNPTPVTSVDSSED